MGAKKQLGQNFLQNKKKLLKMVDVLDSALDGVVEIGPGHGELTHYILEKDFSVICIEKDRDMVFVLQKKFERNITNRKLKIIEGDALGEISNNKFQIINGITDKNYAIVGNIPYYITGHLLRIIGELEHKPKQVILLIQEEVAYRLCAQKGDMNLLAASVGWWAQTRIITRVPRNMFSPQPKVDSAVILLTLNDVCRFAKRDSVKREKELYFCCVRALFKQPRRTAIKNLSDAGIARDKIEEKLLALSMNSLVRPQDFSIDDIIAVSVLFNSQ